MAGRLGYQMPTGSITESWLAGFLIPLVDENLMTNLPGFLDRLEIAQDGQDSAIVLRRSEKMKDPHGARGLRLLGFLPDSQELVAEDQHACLE